jgi:hypothetical protein
MSDPIESPQESVLSLLGKASEPSATTGDDLIDMLQRMRAAYPGGYPVQSPTPHIATREPEKTNRPDVLIDMLSAAFREKQSGGESLFVPLFINGFEVGEIRLSVRAIRAAFADAIRTRYGKKLAAVASRLGETEAGILDALITREPRRLWQKVMESAPDAYLAAHADKQLSWVRVWERARRCKCGCREILVHQKGDYYGDDCRRVGRKVSEKKRGSRAGYARQRRALADERHLRACLAVLDPKRTVLRLKFAQTKPATWIIESLRTDRTLQEKLQALAMLQPKTPEAKFVFRLLDRASEQIVVP